jgi:hypothetical protein
MSPLIRVCLLSVLAPVLWQSQAHMAGAVSTEVRIAKRDCQRLAAHVPAPGVAYESGVDARGRSVVPADLGGAPKIAVPETIVVDIDIDLQDRFGIPANPDSYSADIDVGEVEIAPDGTARFNGELLQDEVQAVLTQRCQQILYGRP